MQSALTVPELQCQLLAAAAKLDELASAVAAARVVRSYDSDRRKSALASSVAPMLSEESAAAAEHMARAGDPYKAAMKALRNDLLTAETAIAHWDAAQCRFDALRSLLSVAKAEMHNL